MAPSAEMAPFTTLPVGFVIFNSVILPWVTVIFTGSTGAMFAVPKAGVELTLATGSTIALDDAAELIGAELTGAEPCADDAGAGPALLTPGTVTDVVPVPMTVEPTVTVTGTAVPPLVAVQAEAATPSTSSSAAMRPRLIEAVCGTTCM